MPTHPQLEPGYLKIRIDDWYTLGSPCPTSAHLIIERADPVAYFAVEILNGIREYQKEDSYPIRINGDLVTITASNRTVTYRVGEYDASRHAYRCAWPDGQDQLRDILSA